MFLGLALVLVALLWARKLRRLTPGGRPSYRGPLLMGGIGIAVFLLYLWLVTQGVLEQ